MYITKLRCTVHSRRRPERRQEHCSPYINLAYTPLQRLLPVLLFDSDIHSWALSSMQGQSALEVRNGEPGSDGRYQPGQQRNPEKVIPHRMYVLTGY
jgi:hypothetical protein